jgi:hypothetical protein
MNEEILKSGQRASHFAGLMTKKGEKLSFYRGKRSYGGVRFDRKIGQTLG